MTAVTRSPHFSSGRPTTAQSSTSGWASRAEQRDPPAAKRSLVMSKNDDDLDYCCDHRDNANPETANAKPAIFHGYPYGLCRGRILMHDGIVATPLGCF